MKLLDQIKIDLRGNNDNDIVTVYIDVADNSLSRKWLASLNQLIKDNYHLEKNYCFFGFVASQRNAEYLTDQMNRSIAAINSANIGYQIDDHFSVANTTTPELKLVHDKLNHLHRYFEDLQGVSGAMSPFYTQADARTRWHIRQLNLLCHEYESLVLSMRKVITAPEWQRPSQLMCWLHAPRFQLDAEDYELFGIDTINRPLGGVFVGVNKAVGKHHWEVFWDEGRDSRVGELTTTTLNSQTEAAGDFDIEWGNNPGNAPWQQRILGEFKTWLINNGFDPDDKSLTIGHPQVAQVDLMRSFGTTDYKDIWAQLGSHLDVFKIQTSHAEATYTYNWSDPDYADQQIKIIQGT
jgi:hypothetical protein